MQGYWEEQENAEAIQRVASFYFALVCVEYFQRRFLAMKGLKKMLLGIAFLMLALMGAIMHEGDFGYVLFIVGAPLGLIFCIVGCFDEQLSSFFKKYISGENEEKKE